MDTKQRKNTITPPGCLPLSAIGIALFFLLAAFWGGDVTPEQRPLFFKISAIAAGVGVILYLISVIINRAKDRLELLEREKLEKVEKGNWETWEDDASFWGGTYQIWNFERQELYNLLGIQEIKVGTLTSSYTRKTGGYQLTKTSENTYDITEKTVTTYDSKTYYILGYDKDTISDVTKFEQIKERIDSFLIQSQEEFEANGGKYVSPMQFNFKYRVRMGWKQNLKNLVSLTAFFIVPGLIYLIYQIIYHLTYNMKNSNLRPLVKKYFEQVKVFEEEIKAIKTK